MLHLACQVEDNWNRKGKVLSHIMFIYIYLNTRLSIVTVCNGAYLFIEYLNPVMSGIVVITAFFFFFCFSSNGVFHFILEVRYSDFVASPETSL